MSLSIEGMRHPPERYPTATDEQVSSIIDEAISKIVRSIQAPVRITQRPREQLFEIAGGMEMAHIYDPNSDHYFAVEPKKLQEIALRVISKYGIDINKPDPDNDRLRYQRDSTVLQSIFYSSKSVPGLVFRRDTTSLVEYPMHPVVGFSWTVEDHGTELMSQFVSAIYRALYYFSKKSN